MNRIMTMLGVMLVLLSVTMPTMADVPGPMTAYATGSGSVSDTGNSSVAGLEANTVVGYPALWAQEESQEIVQLPNPGTIPDSPLYGIKKFFENIGTIFTFGNDAKIQRYINLSERRLAEIIAMEEKGKPVRVEGLINDYNNKIAEVNRLQNTTSINVLEQVADSTSKHLFILEQIRQHVSEQDKSSIDIAINLSQMENQEAIEHIGKENPEKASELTINLTEKRMNRLVAQNRRQNFSSFKDMLISDIDRHIAFLESFKENTTVQSKREIIQNAINRLEKLKEKIPIEISQTTLPMYNRTTPNNIVNMTRNVLTIGTFWNADKPTVVRIEITERGGIPVSGVSIKIDNNSIGTSDSDGRLSYTFPNFGTYLVQASKEGYKYAMVTMKLTSTGVSLYSRATGVGEVSVHSQVKSKIDS